MRIKALYFLLALCLTAICAVPFASFAQSALPVEVPEEGMIIVSGTYYGISKEWFQENNPDGETLSLSVKIPSNVKTIAKDGLRDSYTYDKERYEAVTYNDNIGRYNIISVDFSGATRLETINDQAALRCTQLSGVLDLSNTQVKTIGKLAFSGCTGLTGVILPSTLQYIGSEDAGSAFNNCSGLKFVRSAGEDESVSFILPKQLQVIGRQSFLGCTGLPADTVVTIPKSVTYVGSEAFYKTDAITTIIVETDDASAYHGGAFKGNKHGLGQRLIIFNNAAAKKTFSPSGLSAYKNAVTYEFTLHYGKDQSAKTEPKLYGQAVNVCKINGVWSVDENYIIPSAGASDVPIGYTGGWAYNDTLLTNKTVLKPSGDDLYLEIKKILNNPTVEFIVDGEIIQTEKTTLVLSLTNDCEHKIGVSVSHPLETATDADEKVKFEYKWTDVWKGGSEGPRMQEEGFGRYDEVYKPSVTDTISIRGAKDERTSRQSYSGEDYGDGYYLVEIYGYRCPQSGGQWELFYKSASTVIGPDPDRTVNTAYMFDVVTTGPSAGTSGGGDSVYLPADDLPHITAPSVAQEIVAEAGERAAMAITAENVGTYQWYVDRGDGKGYVPLSGATSAMYETSPVSAANDGYKYICVVTNEHGSATSPVFTLRVLGATALPSTGDGAPLAAWAALLALSGCGAALLKKRKTGEAR